MPRGQPKKFKENEFKELLMDYVNYIYDAQDNGVSDTPTVLGFYRYVNKIKPCSYHTIRRCFDEYWANIKKDFEELRGDLLSRGASLGLYNVTMSIFALKNWCHWTDKASEEQNADVANKQAELLSAIEKAVKDAD